MDTGPRDTKRPVDGSSPRSCATDHNECGHNECGAFGPASQYCLRRRLTQAGRGLLYIYQVYIGRQRLSKTNFHASNEVFIFRYRFPIRRPREHEDDEYRDNPRFKAEENRSSAKFRVRAAFIGIDWGLQYV